MRDIKISIYLSIPVSLPGLRVTAKAVARVASTYMTYSLGPSRLSGSSRECIIDGLVDQVDRSLLDLLLMCQRLMNARI